jgi:glucokinase
VNLGVFGEYKELGIDYKNVIGVFPGTGLGGGIIIHGMLYTGQGSAGELGHMIVEKDGQRCGCGNDGCLEAYASKKGILAYMKKQLKKGRKTSMKDSIKSGILKSSLLKKAHDEGDRVTCEAMERFTEYLGIGLGSFINIFNPELILIGGGIIEAFGKDLLRDIKKQTRKHTMKGLYKQTKIKQSKLDDDAVVYGGYHLLLRSLQSK